MPQIEVKPWDTPFASEQLFLIGLRWGGGEFSWNGYQVESEVEDDSYELQARVFAAESESIYSIGFPQILGFRVLDEMDIEPGTLEGPCHTLLVRNQKAPLTLHNLGEDGQFNFVVVTNDECLEVAVPTGDVSPKVDLLRKVERASE